MIGFLYGKTEYSIKKNTLRIKDYVKYASLYGYNAISITDDNMYGHYKFYKECKENNIKPLIGLEIKYNDDILLAYALDNKGYKNLINISSYIMINNSLEIDVLDKYKSGLYFILINLNINNVLNKYSKYKSILRNVGVGLSCSDKEMYDILIKEKISVYPVDTPLYLKKEDYDVYLNLCMINDDIPMQGNNQLKELELLEKMYEKMPMVFSYFEKLVSYVDIDLLRRNILLPKYKTKDNESSKDYLLKLSKRGLEKRLQNYMGNKDIYFDRLYYELKIIDDMGYNDYFLIVWDFIRYAKNNKVLVGPGRGSAAGSLVAYSIGINNINPLEYDLLFERFLNPERITLPDIDTDFPDDKRNMIIEYVRDLYNPSHVCSIITFDKFKIKSALRELGRIRRIDSTRLDEIVKSASKAYDDGTYQELMDKSIPEIKEILKISLGLIDLPRHVSTHTAGIIVSNDNLFDLIPLRSGNNIYQSQLEASDLEELGLLKIDFLAIRELTILNDIISRIDIFNNLNIYDIPKNDKLTFDLLSRGETTGIFQLDSQGITKTIKNLKPNKFDDLVALLALYRPGPIQYINEYIERKNGKKFEYISKDLEPILKETYGIIIYQEQIMQICLKFAGYSLGEADVLRRAVSKKKSDVLDFERTRFVNSSVSLGYSKDIANKIYDDIVKFANYGFNKSHSVAYANLTYVMAYLKANYKKEYIIAQLDNSIGNTKETIYYINYAKSNGIKVLGPILNYSFDKYEVYKDSIVMPLSSIKQVSTKLAREIKEDVIKYGKFKTFVDFKCRINMPKDTLKSIIYSSACDIFKKSKKSLINAVENVDVVIDNYLSDKINDDTKEFDLDFLKEKEQEVLGFNIKYNLFRDIDLLINKYKTTKLSDMKKDIYHKIICSFDEIKEIMTKKEEIMLVGNVNDGYNKMNCVIFPKNYETLRNKIKKNVLYVIKGKYTEDNFRNEAQLIIDSLDEVK